MRNDRIIDGIIKAGTRRVTWRRIMALLCVITVLMTTNQMVFKADTLERIPACGYAEHVHDESCFDGDSMPVCGLEEHTHTDACYQQRPHKAADEIQVALEPPVEEVEMQLGEAVETGEVTETGEAAETGEVEAGEDSGLTIEHEEPAPTEIIAADEESADEMSEELFVVTEAGDAIAGQRTVALDFTGYIATDAHTIYFYDADRAAVLVMLEELAEADGVAMTATEGTLAAEAMMGLAEIEAALEAAPEDIDALMSEVPVAYENGVLIITGDGEVTVDDTLYTVTGLTLPARAVRAQDAAGEITVSTADGQATLLDVTPAFTETASDTEAYADVFDRIAGLLPENTVTESPEEIETAVAEAGDFQLTDEEAAPQRRLMAAAPAAETLPRERMSRVLNMRLFDIALIGADGATEPGAPIHVETTFNAPISGEDFTLYHIVDGEPVPVEDAIVVDENNNAIGLSFDTPSLSPFAVAYYTVDFHWSVDGNHYDISIPGGGFIRLSELVRVLNVIPEEEDIAEFLAEVANVEFSDPELVRVVKVEETAAFGAIKEALGLESAYSVELTDEEIAAINAETVEAGDWALVSLRPFNTEETLTVTMQNGEAFTIYVTDAQTRVDVAGKHGVTNAENVGVYSGHNLVINSQIDTIETIGTRVTLLGMESGSLSLSSWYQISYLKNGETATGYVETKYIDILEMAEPVTVDNDAFGVTASWEEGVLPDGTVLAAGEPSLTEEEMEALENQALNALPTIPGKILKVTGIHFFDLSFMADGVEIEPNGEVNVSMQLKQAIAVEENESLNLVHFTNGTAELLENAVFTKDGSENLTGLDFTVGSFSTFAIVKTIETTFVASNGETYEVTVYYPEEANIPEGSTLRVIEFTEADKAYEYARNAVLADKKARGEWVDLSSFGLAALDISIIAPNDEEIEPAVPVQVEMTIKSLPGVDDLSEVADTLAIQHHVEVEDGVVVETVYNGNTDASFRMETNATVIAEGTPVDPESVSEEDFQVPEAVITDELETEFEVVAFSTFTISWDNHYGKNVEVHYVDENGSELTVDNSKFPTTLNGSSTSPAYLIYDIDGYEYDHTYRSYLNDNGRWRTHNIVPQLRRNDYGWRYSTDGSSWNYLSYNYSEYSDDIYVVYKEKKDIVPGGHPTVKQSDDVKPPVSPRINKESTPNGDDTNTLALSLISDTAKLEVEKLADVIVVFDVSASMKNNNLGNKTRLQAAKDAVNSLATALAQKKNSAGQPLVRMSLIEFSTKASPVIGLTELTDTGLSTFEQNVNGLNASGGTNWDHALQLANEENDLDSERGTFVIFVTDGDPTFRNTRMNLTDAQLANETQNGYANPWYVSPYNDNVYGPGDSDYDNRCYDAAVEQGETIVAAGKNIYTIGISNDVTKVSKFNSDIKGAGAYLASNTAALNKAFADIEASITGESGWGNIQMTDGITNLTNTVQKTGLTNVGGDFTYWKAPAPENWASMTEAQKNAYTPAASAFVEWDPEAAGAELAEYNKETGAVEWNMGSTFMPEAGVTYQVRFKVWPSQEAYDTIAKLNNKTISYDTLPAAVQAQIIKNGNTYTLKTNEPDAKTTYQAATRTGKTVTVSGEEQTLMFPTVKDLNLHVDKLKVKKEWKNDLDPDSRWKSSVTLHLTDSAGNLYKSIDLNEKNHYTMEDNFISCGLAKIEKGELVIYEQGHDFKLTEPEIYAYYWDLDADVYRPMVIDATLTMLVKTDAPSGMGNKTYYEEQGVKYYKIGESTYKAISTGDAAAAITATNVRRSNLNLTKKVVDEANNPVTSADLFEFTITVNNERDTEVWFSVQKDASDPATVVKDLDTNATKEVKDGVPTGYYYAASKSPITVSIRPGWNLRFTNMPNGTTFTIEENLTSGSDYTFVSAAIDNEGEFSVTEGTTTGNGTIKESNKQYTVTYTNKAEAKQVYIKKTGQDGMVQLAGAVFNLYTKADYEATPRGEPVKAGLTSKTDSLIDLGKLPVGTYYLEEIDAPAGYNRLTEPVEIVVGATDVTYTQSENTLSLSHGGIEYDSTTKTYTLTVTNSAGYELPSTGGPGTLGYTLTGALLILAAALLLLRRRAE